jgi:PAT family beta-lactamase induction signal transducer AmpG
MALGMMIPGMWSGWLQDHLGYVPFFGWVLVATLPSVVMAALIRIPDGFGMKQAEAAP